MLPFRRLFLSIEWYDIPDRTSKYRLIIRYSIYQSIAIPRSIDIEYSQVSRYFDISSIEPALLVNTSTVLKTPLGSQVRTGKDRNHKVDHLMIDISMYLFKYIYIYYSDFYGTNMFG